MLRIIGFVFMLLFHLGKCGELTVSHYPSSITFSSADTLRLSSLDDVIAASLGYTPQESSWRGLTVSNPFKSPSAAVLIGIETEKVKIKHQGTKYSVKEDTTISDTFHRTINVVGGRAQRPTFFKHITMETKKNESVRNLPEVKFLDNSEDIDVAFLNQISSLPESIHSAELESSVRNGGQDVLFIDIDSLAPLVKAHGKSSKKVEEAIRLLQTELTSITEKLRKFYDDDVVIYTANLDTSEVLNRRTRSLLDNTEIEDVNLATEYGEDYPAIFNIILFMAIVLSLAIIATAMSMAYMDPGRDSIIYRMTNPRMKKDQ